MLSIPKDTKPLISNFIIFKCNWNLKIVNNVSIVCLITFTGYLQLDWRTDWRNGTVHPLQLTSKEAGRRRKSRNTHCNKNENVISDFHFLLLFFSLLFLLLLRTESFVFNISLPPTCLGFPPVPLPLLASCPWRCCQMEQRNDDDAIAAAQVQSVCPSVSQSATLWVSVVRRKTRVSFRRGVTLTWR